MENKILELFEKQDIVSMNKDIFPILWDEFGGSQLNEEMYATASEFINQLLCGVYTAGIHVICVPKFSGNIATAALYVSDIEYRKVSYPK